MVMRSFDWRGDRDDPCLVRADESARTRPLVGGRRPGFRAPQSFHLELAPGRDWPRACRIGDTQGNAQRADCLYEGTRSLDEARSMAAATSTGFQRCR